MSLIGDEIFEKRGDDRPTGHSTSTAQHPSLTEKLAPWVTVHKTPAKAPELKPSIETPTMPMSFGIREPNRQIRPEHPV